MELTISQITIFITTIVSLIGGIEFLLSRFNKILQKQLEPIKTDLSNEIYVRMKASLVNYQSLAENGLLNDVQKQNYYEQLDEYTKLGYNSYVHENHEKLHKEGKI